MFTLGSSGDIFDLTLINNFAAEIGLNVSEIISAVLDGIDLGSLIP